MAGGLGALSIGSTILKSGGSIAGGLQQSKSLKREADAVLANATRESYEIGREGEVLQSNAQAASAAGGGSFDAGTVERHGEIGRDTDYNSLAALFEGKNQRRELRRQARRAKISGFVGGAGSILDGAHSFLSK